MKKYGMNDTNEFYFYNSASNTFSNNISLLVPYINEYTFDMLHYYVYAPNTQIPFVTTESVDFKERLKNRRKILLMNGIIITFENSIYLKKVTLKEVFHNNAIHLLCKMETLAGDVTVRYNAKTGGFFSPFNHMDVYCAELQTLLKML